jgi:predicted dehydrogenase/threonine dehydrogenase-like Zn-dependent dehydrogenase
LKEVIQSFRTGELTVAEVPTPQLRPQGILVRTAATVVSAGTERMVIEFAEKNLLQKARARPDLVRQVIDKAQREGIVTTLESVRNRLDQPLPLGYSATGIVAEVGARAGHFQVGDRVACAGGGYASHAEMIYVPRTLAVKLPDGVSFESAAFTTVGAIALQGVRQAEVELGHNVAVIGLGLLGLLTVQLLGAAGCDVLGVDLNPARVELAQRLGARVATDPGSARAAGLQFTQERGFDAVIITAETPSNDPVTLAGDLARDRAIISAVGAVGMTIPRKVYYEKELDFRLSRSYGPGRYDTAYEEEGHDYPYGYVRWTEQRNMEAFVSLLASGAVDVSPLISHRFAIDEAERAYDVITGKSGEPFMGVLLTYNPDRALPERIELHGRRTPVSTTAPQAAVRVGLLGAGNFVNAALLPAMAGIDGLELTGIVSGSGVTAQNSGQRFGFRYCASDPTTLLADPDVNWIVVATRHDLHASQAIVALQAGKDVFVEKPLALQHPELVDVLRAQHASGRRLIVGFNRRFSPFVAELRAFLRARQRPLIATYRVNAGVIPANHWTQDPGVGGGRIIGEGCHFIDLLQHLIGAAPVQVHSVPIQTGAGPVDDEVVMTLTFADGSVGTIVYAAGGDKAFGKERIEVIGDGKVAVLDDFRSLELVADGKRNRRQARLRPEKGHRQEWEALVAAARKGSEQPIPLDEIVLTHLATYAAVESLQARAPVSIDAAAFWSAVQGE